MKGLLLILALLALPSAARAQAVIADLTQHLIAITTGFTGTDVTLFGATDGESDLIVIVRGPENKVTVRRKERILGLWLNAHSATYEGVPGFYAIAATKPIGDILRGEMLVRQQIGVENLALVPTRDDLSDGDQLAFREALIRGKQQTGLFSSQIGTVTTLGNRLFRTALVLPSNVPVGYYQVHVYAVRGGQIVGAQTTPLEVQQIGAAAELSDLAHVHGLIYGLLAIGASILVGWLGSLVFRRA
ncbi:TIGR02186 family protein [Lacibacterium aquatile]|uniref:TIGR02186 family protein n=1 Tax=Lacibacterium aquatile TaxID=1168082 RepID=A0ABW5DPX9_9PROT